MGGDSLKILSGAAAGIKLRAGIEGNITLDNLSGELSGAAVSV